MQSLGKRFMLLFHTFGIACLISAVCLEALVFSDILMRGYFRAVEGDPLILGLELVITAYGAVYLAYMFLRFIKRS